MRPAFLRIVIIAGWTATSAFAGVGAGVLGGWSMVLPVTAVVFVASAATALALTRAA